MKTKMKRNRVKIIGWKDTQLPSEDQMLRSLRMVMREAGSGRIQPCLAMAVVAAATEIRQLVDLRLAYERFKYDRPNTVKVPFFERPGKK